MTCPEPVCVVTPRPPATPAPTKLAPELGTNPITETIKRVTTCDGCELTLTPIPITTRQPTRQVTMSADPCTTPAPPQATVYESTKSVTLRQAFTKNNCATGSGSVVTYSTTADATAYSMTSQAAADAQANQLAQQSAQDDVTNNGQAYANLNGTCA